VFDPLAVVLLITAVKMIREKPKKVKTEEIAIIEDIEGEGMKWFGWFDNEKEGETVPEDLQQVPAAPVGSKGRKLTTPKWLKGATATTKGWVDSKGNVLKAMQLTKEEVEQLNKE